MMILHDERKEMALFKHIPILQTAKFVRFKQKMRKSLANDNNPLDYTLEAVLPGMHLQFHSMEERQGNMERQMGNTEERLIVKIQKEGKATRVAVADGLEAAAEAMRQGRPGAVSGQMAILRGSSSRGKVEQTKEGWGHQYYTNHKSVRSIYNQYYGLGDFYGGGL
jgi:hypothetical protein